MCSWWGWWRENRDVAVVVEGKQLKCVAGGGGGGGGGGKTLKMWWW